MPARYLAACTRSARYGRRLLLVQQEQGVGGQGGVVGDHAVPDHRLEPVPRHPLLAHVLLFRLPLGRPRFQAGGQEQVAGLVGGAVRAVQETEPGQFPGGEAGFLAQFEPGQVGRRPGPAGREAALRERPGPALDRVPEFFDQVEPAVLGRDDQGEVGLLDDRVGSLRSVPAFDPVLPQADPVILVDDPGAEGPDVGSLGLGGHGPHVTEAG